MEDKAIREEEFVKRFMEDDPTLSNELEEEYKERLRKRNLFYLFGGGILIMFFLVSYILLQNLLLFLLFFFALCILTAYLFYVLEGEYTAYRRREDYFDK